MGAAEIDYFFSGAQVEPVEHPERNYSERLVLLPGCGTVHAKPDYSPRGNHKTTDELIINCPWNAQKMNYPFALMLRELIQRSRKRINYRLFVSASLNKQNDYLPFVRDLHGLIGSDSFEVVRERPYQEYMAIMEEGCISLDSYPFGGCNTVVDSLYLRKLTVCHEGSYWYNRIGPAMLRMLGLSELVASTEVETVDITLRLIHDDAFRGELQTRLDSADLESTIFDRTEATFFRKAVDMLIANRERLRGDSLTSPFMID